MERLSGLQKTDPPIEYKFSVPDAWSRRLFLALLTRYGLRSYRYSGQRYTTIMVRVPKSFVDETLWPEYVQMSATLRQFLEEVTDRVICDIFHQKPQDAADDAQNTPILELPTGQTSE
jgi:hypothetical protein